jgi:hypothetical protein
MNRSEAGVHEGGSYSQGVSAAIGNEGIQQAQGDVHGREDAVSVESGERDGIEGSQQHLPPKPIGPSTSQQLQQGGTP